MKSKSIKQFVMASAITLAIFYIISIGFATRVAAGDYDVDSGNQATTYKSQNGQKSSDDSSNRSHKDDDSHDRSENDAGHSKNTDQSASATGDVLIDQSTYKNRPPSK